jgi:gamma-glutamyltranspeptidase
VWELPPNRKGEERYVQVEPSVDSTIVEALRQRGHKVTVDEEIDFVCCGQIIWRLPSGFYVAGSESRPGFIPSAGRPGSASPCGET